MKLPAKPIESATVSFSGEREAGIQPMSFDVQMFFDPTCMGDEDALEALVEIKNKLVDAYEAITGERGHVVFDYEINEAEAKIDAAIGGAKQKVKLKIWNGRACSPIYDHFYVCAFNQKDASKLIVQAKRSIDNQNPIQDWEIARMTREIKVYFSKGCWGNSMNGIKQERGVWATTKNDRIPKRLI